MAIGDTVQAGLLKADFSPIERGGAAKGQAYRAIGEGIGSALDKFAKNKQEGEAAEMGINAMIAGMDNQQKEELLSGESKLGKTYNKFLDGELSNSQKKAFLGGLATYNTTYRQNMADQMARDKFKIEEAEARRDAIRFNRDQQNLINENQFMQSLMSQITDPQAQRQADIARPGLAALGNGDARNRFMQAQLQQPQNQVPVSSLGSQDFGRFASREGLDPELSVARMEELREAELANQPKPMTPKELAEYEQLLLENEKLRIANLQAGDKLDKTLNPPIGDESYTDAVLNAIDGIYDIMDNGPKTKGPVSGLGAETFMNIGGSNAANAAALIKTIMSDVAFSRLQKMRNDSPTGGALGQVSNIELELLKSAMGSLDQKISPPLFRKNLDSIKKHYDNFMRSIQARNLAAQQGLTFKTTEEAISWMDKNVPMGGQPASDKQTNVTTPGGFSIRKN